MRDAEELETTSSSGGAASVFGAYPSAGISLNYYSRRDASFDSFIVSANGSPSALESEFIEPLLIRPLYADVFSPILCFSIAKARFLSEDF